ncbi:MAG: ATP phosphoribosyltransferase regulatory subunit [Clostridiales bacterium]|nr:ATP phosphoribosyltransferase regulatory subunit [Clostridiales bacterium]
MGNYRFHTPDGVIDILPQEASVKRKLETDLRVLFASNGYSEVETPAIEYYDVYASGDFVATEDMYKMTDKDGRIIALRYDGTIPVARLAATLLKDEQPPLRLSYIENMFRFKESGGGKLREFSQAGVELLGLDTAEADAEVIALGIRSALSTGLTDLQISIGQVEFFRGLVEEWGISTEDASELSTAIDQKDIVRIEKTAERLGLSEDAKELLDMISNRFGTYDVIDEFESRVGNETSRAALKNLRAILDALADYELLQYVSIDLGMLRSLDYYTGMIFKGFTYEVGFPILGGGRYNKVVSTFGRELSAVGFSLGINLCLTALRRQDKLPEFVKVDAIVGYADGEGMRKAAFATAAALRETGLKVIVDQQHLSEAELDVYAEEHGIDQTVFVEEEEDDGTEPEEENT